MFYVFSRSKRENYKKNVTMRIKLTKKYVDDVGKDFLTYILMSQAHTKKMRYSKPCNCRSLYLFPL